MLWFRYPLRAGDDSKQICRTGGGQHGNFEVVVQKGDQLCHYWRNNTWNPKKGYEWNGPTQCFGENIRSAPALIQSDFIEKGARYGNFEVLVQQGDQLCHWYRNNADCTGTWRGSQCFGENIRSAPTMIQSSFGSRQHKNFEVVVQKGDQKGDQLCHYWRNNTWNPEKGFEWNAPDPAYQCFYNSSKPAARVDKSIMLRIMPGQ